MITAATFFGGSQDVVNVTANYDLRYHKRVQRYTSSGGTWTLKLTVPPIPQIGFGPHALIVINENAGGGLSFGLRDPSNTLITSLGPQKVAIVCIYPGTDLHVASAADLSSMRYTAFVRDLFMT